MIYASFDNHSRIIENKWLVYAGCAIIGLLFFLWPIPHTISVRDLLALIGTGLFAYLFYKSRTNGISLKELRAPVIIYAVLFLWLIVVAVLVSDEPGWSLDEIRGQWLKATIIMVMGGLIALSIQADRNLINKIIKLIVFILLVHVLYLDLNAVLVFLNEGVVPKRINGLTDGPDRINFLTNMLFAFLFAEFFFRTTSGKKLLPFGNTILVLLMILALFSIYIAGVRNGVITFFFLSLMLAYFFLFEYRERARKSILYFKIVLIMIIAVAIGFISTKNDPRWYELIETIPIALDTKTHKAWLDWEKYPHPRLANGKLVGHSNYTRIAWFKEGSLIVLENPLGVGFGRNAFGHALKTKYNEGRGHSHSGILDFAIGAGVPGALMWIGFLASLLILAVKHFKLNRNYYSVVLAFLLVDFSIRMIIDSVIRDHMLQQFLFLIGFLTISMLIQTYACDKNTAKAVN